MAFPNTSWPTSVDTVITRTDGTSVVYAADFEYQDLQIRTVQTWLGETGDLIGEGVAGGGPSGAVSPEADGGTAFTIAAREDFTSGTLLSVGDNFDGTYSEKFSVEYDGQTYIDGNRVLTEGSGEIASISAKATPIPGDYILIEDSADSNSKKSITIGDLPSGTDADAIHDNVAGEINAISEKVSPASTDVLVIEDSAVGYVKKRVQITNLPGGADPNAVHVNGVSEFAGIPTKAVPVAGDVLLIEDSDFLGPLGAKKQITIGTLPTGGDADAIHDNVSGEIAAVAAKATPTTSDYLLIEDAAATNAKKSITIGALPDVRGPSIVIGNAAAGDTAAVCDVLDAGDGTLLKSTIEGASAGDYIFVRPGTYDIGSGPGVRISIPTKVRVSGAGSLGGDGTVIQVAQGADGRAFNMGAFSVLSDMHFNVAAPTITQTQVGYLITTGVACKVSGLFFGFSGTWTVADTAINGVFGVYGNYTDIMNCRVSGLPSTTTSPQFDGVFVGATYKAWLRNIYISGGYNGLYVNRGHVWADQLDLVDYTRNGVKFVGWEGTQGELHLTNSYLDGKVLSTHVNNGIEATKAGAGVNRRDCTVTNVVMTNDQATPANIGYGITLTDTDNWNIQGCQVGAAYGGGPGNAILLSATSDNNIVLGNRVYGWPVSDLGTGNEVAHNI